MHKGLSILLVSFFSLPKSMLISLVPLHLLSTDFSGADDTSDDSLLSSADLPITTGLPPEFSFCLFSKRLIRS
uniref:Uncharacterized protein LOC105631354 isoform X2 n=1 Tax=Rhizophora mucronata TaxID=61149 RepID=A0A2P2M4E8_RHIMU